MGPLQDIMRFSGARAQPRSPASQPPTTGTTPCSCGGWGGLSPPAVGPTQGRTWLCFVLLPAAQHLRSDGMPWWALRSRIASCRQNVLTGPSGSPWEGRALVVLCGSSSCLQASRYPGTHSPDSAGRRPGHCDQPRPPGGAEHWGTGCPGAPLGSTAGDRQGPISRWPGRVQVRLVSR